MGLGTKKFRSPEAQQAFADDVSVKSSLEATPFKDSKKKIIQKAKKRRAKKIKRLSRRLGRFSIKKLKR